MSQAPKNITPMVLEKMLSREILAKSDELIDCFVGLIQEVYEPSVESMFISAHSPVDSDTAGPSFWRYLGGSDKLITNKKSGNFAGDARELNFQFGDLTYVERDEFYDVGYADILGNIISDWTYDCWLKAGGWFFKIPTTLTIYTDPGYGEDRELTKLKVTSK